MRKRSLLKSVIVNGRQIVTRKPCRRSRQVNSACRQRGLVPTGWESGRKQSMHTDARVGSAKILEKVAKGLGQGHKSDWVYLAEKGCSPSGWLLQQVVLSEDQRRGEHSLDIWKPAKCGVWLFCALMCRRGLIFWEIWILAENRDWGDIKGKFGLNLFDS